MTPTPLRARNMITRSDLLASYSTDSVTMPDVLFHPLLADESCMLSLVLSEQVLLLCPGWPHFEHEIGESLGAA
jgi:hypothetical protein